MNSKLQAKESDLSQALVEFTTLCKEAKKVVDGNKAGIRQVNSAYANALINHKGRAANKSKLKKICGECLEELENEENALIQVLQKIQHIRKLEQEITSLRPVTIMRRGVLMKMLQESAHNLPMWLGRPGKKLDPLVGCIPAPRDYRVSPGDRVAAQTQSEDGAASPHHHHSGGSSGDSPGWILATVLAYDDSTKCYQVEDVDTEEGNERYFLHHTKVIPLPKWKANPVLNPEAFLPKGCEVLALYPQTTCFYKAVVERPPQTIADDYSLFFEDPSYPEGYAPALKIPQNYVIQHRKK